ncbi:uncharacterized protein LOC111247860 [Varroa destructor]|uniref:Uncharacterized protein n=1 Tax=Varroa destructor TaxID=109461 RepID=A0A7M7JPW2_VARDE|nr:uncharacterized protein LOC111247860 [Varroa destructor]
MQQRTHDRMPRQKKGSRKTKKKRLSGNDGEDLLKMIGLSSNPDKKYMTNESINLLEEIGRCYTETGRHTGETEGDNLLMLIGASSADQAVKAVNCAPDPSSIIAQVQADALARRKQTEEQDHGGYPQGIR